jgi:hypothetical protein
MAPAISAAITTQTRMAIQDSPMYRGIFTQPGALNPDGSATPEARARLRAMMISDGHRDDDSLTLRVDSALTPVPYSRIEKDSITSLMGQHAAGGGTAGEFSALMEVISPGTVVGEDGVLAASAKRGGRIFGNFDAPSDDLQSQINNLGFSHLWRQNQGNLNLPGGAAPTRSAVAGTGATPKTPGAPAAAGSPDSEFVYPLPVGKRNIGPQWFKEADIKAASLPQNVRDVIKEQFPGTTPEDFIDGKNLSDQMWRGVDGLVSWDTQEGRFIWDDKNATSWQRGQMNRLKTVLTQLTPYMGIELTLAERGRGAAGLVSLTQKRATELGLFVGGSPLPRRGVMTSELMKDNPGLSEGDAVQSMRDSALFSMPQFKRATGLDQLGEPQAINEPLPEDED